MFSVLFTPEAKTVIAEQFKQGDFNCPGLMIHRVGPSGEVTRTHDGGTEWSVERQHPWRALVGDYGAVNGVVIIEGIPIWLALIPKPGELGVQVSVKNAELFVEVIVA